MEMKENHRIEALLIGNVFRVKCVDINLKHKYAELKVCYLIVLSILFVTRCIG